MQGGRGAVAAVCCDRDGKYMGSSSITLNGVIDVAVLEAMAYREAHSLASNLMVTHILICSDSNSVIKDIEANTGGVHAAVIKELIARKNVFEEC